MFSFLKHLHVVVLIYSFIAKRIVYMCYILNIKRSQNKRVWFANGSEGENVTNSWPYFLGKANIYLFYLFKSLSKQNEVSQNKNYNKTTIILEHRVVFQRLKHQLMDRYILTVYKISRVWSSSMWSRGPKLSYCVYNQMAIERALRNIPQTSVRLIKSSTNHDSRTVLYSNTYKFIPTKFTSETASLNVLKCWYIQTWAISDETFQNKGNNNIDDKLSFNHTVLPNFLYSSSLLFNEWITLSF